MKLNILRSAAALLVCICLITLTAAGCADTENVTTPVPEGHTIAEEPVGLIGFEDPIPDGFTFEILPDADDQIYEITVSYRLGDEAWGSETMTTEDGDFFGYDDVVLKSFRIADLSADEDIPPMTLSFRFTDADGDSVEAKNEYTVDAPQTEGWYLVKITGSKEAGYELADQ